jgi:hypothetical protein
MIRDYSVLSSLVTWILWVEFGVFFSEAHNQVRFSSLDGLVNANV